MRLKTCPVSVKVSDDPAEAEKGIVEAIVATWDLDSVGDKIVKGAFADDLAEWTKRAESGHPQPFIWSHMHADPNAHIGWVLEGKETDKGLWVKAQVDLDDPPPGSYNAQVWRLLKSGRINQFSFAYDVLEGGHVDQKDADGNDQSYYELRKLKTFEVGPCLIGANQATELISAKSAAGSELRVAIEGVSAAQSDVVSAAVTAALGAVDDSKAGRVLAAKHADALRTAKSQMVAALEHVDAVLTAAGPAGTETSDGEQPSDDEKGSSHPAPDGSDAPAPVEGKADDVPTGPAPAARLARIDVDLAALAAVDALAGL